MAMARVSAGVEARSNARAASRHSQRLVSAYPTWFLSGGYRFRRAIRFSDLRVVLLQSDALDAVRLDLHRPRQLHAPILARAVPYPWGPQHADLCGGDLGSEGRSRAPAGGAAHVAGVWTKLSPLRRVLPGAGEHDRRGHHVHRADAPDNRCHQRDTRSVRHPWPWLAHRSAHRSSVP